MILTASIVTHNTDPDMLQKALRSLCATPVNHIFIVDNSPCHPLPPSLPSSSSSLHFITCENRGFGAAHNIAIKEAMKLNSDYHLIINPDVHWDGDAISPLTRYMQQHPNVGAAMPRIIYPDGTLQYACRMLPSPFILFAKRFLPHAWISNKLNRYLLADADHHKIFNVPYLLGSIILFRVDALKDVGLFDERFFMYPEDIDITRRLHRKWLTLFLPLSTVTHHHAAESRKNIKMLKIHLFNMCKYFNKWGWWWDPERARMNMQLRKNLPTLPPSRQEPGRG